MTALQEGLISVALALTITLVYFKGIEWLEQKADDYLEEIEDD